MSLELVCSSNKPQNKGHIEILNVKEPFQNKTRFCDTLKYEYPSIEGCHISSFVKHVTAFERFLALYVYSHMVK